MTKFVLVAVCAVALSSGAHAGSMEPTCPTFAAALAVAEALYASEDANGAELMGANGCTTMVPLATVSAKDTVEYLLPGNEMRVLTLAKTSSGEVAMVTSPNVILVEQ